ncbi:hypothetical protein ACFO3J_11570 [Streptomyces polygonati]|uniref:Uncharacterized protein n=1 Tax=Streptomyces polygonati TaxID=1617087 RepID=A0ABV8HJB2_9ACTN
MTTDLIAEVKANFKRFVSGHTDPDIDDTTVYLETLLAEWLYIGMGIEATAANYDHFLQVVLAITDDVLQGTARLDYSGPEAARYRRSISGLVDPKRGDSVLTRFGYDRLVWQTQEGRRSDELRGLVARTLTTSEPETTDT